MADESSYRTVAQFCARHPAFTPPALRDLIFKSRARKTSKGTLRGNGFAPAFIRLGRRILIDERVFFQILDTHRQEALAAKENSSEGSDGKIRKDNVDRKDALQSVRGR